MEFKDFRILLNNVTFYFKAGIYCACKKENNTNTIGTDGDMVNLHLICIQYFGI